MRQKRITRRRSKRPPVREVEPSPTWPADVTYQGRCLDSVDELLARIDDLLADGSR